MSLSTWFNDFFYTPIAIGKRDWGKFGVVYASMLTFLILGLWHGPNWTFVCFGLIHGIFVALELFTAKVRKKARKYIFPWIVAVFGMFYTYLVFAFSCIFFRSVNVSEAFYSISHLEIAGLFSMEGLRVALQNHSLDISDYVLLAFSIGLMFQVEWKNIVEKITKFPVTVRWLIYYVFLTVIIVYSVRSGPGFIYKQF